MKGKLTPVIFSDILLHIQEELQKRFFLSCIGRKILCHILFLENII